MPYQRPTLSELRSRNRNFIRSELENTGELLRFSNLGILADMDAGMSHLHFSYLDWIARQSNPFTAEDEWLAAWGALKNIYRKDASAAQGTGVLFNGTTGSTVATGSLLNRSNGMQYRLDAAVTLDTDGIGLGDVTALFPPNDSTLTPVDGNAAAGTQLVLDQAVPGIDSSATVIQPLTGGADMEKEQDFRRRVLRAFQTQAEGGSESDYRRWALSVPGVTRAWVSPRLLGAGSVGLYIMCDGDDRTNQGFPEGTDGVATQETYLYAKATGDQRRVADSVFLLRPVTTLVWVCSPLKKIIDFDIGGIPQADTDTVAAINDTIDQVFFENGEPGGKIYLSDLNQALGSLAGARGLVLNSPSGTIIPLSPGELPLRGNVTFSGDRK